MKRRGFLGLTLIAPLAWACEPVLAAVTQASPAARVPDGQAHRFAFANGRFLLDGEHFQIRSGEMHPARIPREYWRHRIRMARAMGLNTVALYVMWNQLEVEPGVFDLDTDTRDFGVFIDLCKEEGMWVYLRPGPYICGEWNLGGLPAYLLRDADARLRSRTDAGYMAAVDRYIGAIAPRVSSRMVGAGGPILMLQVENEYAMFDSDLGYLQAIEAMWRRHGVDGPFSIADGLTDLRRRRPYLPGAALGLDGADVADLKQGHALFAHDAPVWVSEGYPGWLTHWGEPEFAHKDYTKTLRDVIAHGYSFSLYVVHGGTNFGLTAGANAEDDGTAFQPVITSYDYGAPINERGDATRAFHQLRAAITSTARVVAAPIPASMPRARFDDAIATPHASLWENLPASPAHVPRPVANESLFGQDQGLVLYRREIDGERQLTLAGVHDYAVVHVAHAESGHVSRVAHPKVNSSPVLGLPACTGKDRRTLEILVDTFGHVNFGPALGDRKGLLGDVQLDGNVLNGWDVFPLPLDDAWLTGLKPLGAPATRGGMFFKASISVTTPGDTYLDMGEWDKGYVWVNGHLLGRYWHIGPQQSLYCPNAWLHQGSNEVLVLDLHRIEPAHIRRADGPGGVAA